MVEPPKRIKPILSSRDKSELEELMELRPYEEVPITDPNLDEVLDAILRHFEALEEREQWVVRGVVMQGQSLQDVADELNLSKPHVWRIRNKAFDTLRQAMEQDGIITSHLEFLQNPGDYND